MTTAASASAARSTTQAWSEDFDGAAGAAVDPKLFTLRTGGNGWGNEELQSYTPGTDNVRLDGAGHLLISAEREKHTGTDGISREWTSARMDSLGLYSFSTGTIAIRMKAPGSAGTWPAFWLEGANVASVPWPNCGEIDVAEILGEDDGVYQSVHGPDETAHGYTYTAHTAAPAGVDVFGDYHVFAVTRSVGRVTFSIDGKTTGTLSTSTLQRGQKWVLDGPMFLILNLAMGGWAGPPSSSTPARNTLTVDWIRFTPEGGTQ